MGMEETPEEKKASAFANMFFPFFKWVILKIIQGPVISTALALFIGLGGGGFLTHVSTNFSISKKSSEHSVKLDSVIKIVLGLDVKTDSLSKKLDKLGIEEKKTRGTVMEINGAKQAAARYEQKEKAYQRDRAEHGDPATSSVSPDSVEHFAVIHYKSK